MQENTNVLSFASWLTRSATMNENHISFAKNSEQLVQSIKLPISNGWSNLIENWSIQRILPSENNVVKQPTPTVIIREQRRKRKPNEFFWKKKEIVIVVKQSMKWNSKNNWSKKKKMKIQKMKGRKEENRNRKNAWSEKKKIKIQKCMVEKEEKNQNTKRHDWKTRKSKYKNAWSKKKKKIKIQKGMIEKQENQSTKNAWSKKKEINIKKCMNRLITVVNAEAPS